MNLDQTDYTETAETTNNNLPVLHQRPEERANKVIRKYTVASTGLGFIPNPIANVASTATTQMLMIRELCQIYNVPFQRDIASTTIQSFVGSVVSKAFGFIAAALIPGAKPLGRLNLVGGGISGLYNNTIGEFYKIHFQNGGTLENASVNDLIRYFKQEYDRGDISLSKITGNPVKIIKNTFGNNQEV